MFDDYLRKLADTTGARFVPFDIHDDYDEYVDGKPRPDGVRDFLASRGITLPEGTPDDPPATETVSGLGNRKNELVLKHISEDGVEVYEGSVRYLEAAARAGLRRAVVSSSANTEQVLKVTGLEHFFEIRVDGVTIRERSLRGKPAPDTYLDAARQLGVEPGRAAVFEDALSGVAAGHAGHFGYVVGVDRVGQAAALAQQGASRVVKDLAELLDDGFSDHRAGTP
jgi:HAD superfamily hydrolase (TIGR01509 family)